MSETTCKDVAACLWQDGACAANPASQTFISKLLDPALDNAFACAQHAAEDVCTPLGCVWQDGACQAGFDQHNLDAAQVLGWIKSLSTGGKAYAQEVQKLAGACAPHAAAAACTDAAEYCAWSPSKSQCAVASDKWNTVLGLPLRSPAATVESVGQVLAKEGGDIMDILENTSVSSKDKTVVIDCDKIKVPKAVVPEAPVLSSALVNYAKKKYGWTVQFTGTDTAGCTDSMAGIMSVLAQAMGQDDGTAAAGSGTAASRTKTAAAGSGTAPGLTTTIYLE